MLWVNRGVLHTHWTTHYYTLTAQQEYVVDQIYMIILKQNCRVKEYYVLFYNTNIKLHI